MEPLEAKCEQGGQRHVQGPPRFGGQRLDLRLQGPERKCCAGARGHATPFAELLLQHVQRSYLEEVGYEDGRGAVQVPGQEGGQVEDGRWGDSWIPYRRVEAAPVRRLAGLDVAGLGPRPRSPEE